MKSYNYTPQIAEAIHNVKKPFERATAQVIDFPSKLAVQPKYPADEFTFEERMMVNEYLFKLQAVVETFGVECRVFGFDDIKG